MMALGKDRCAVTILLTCSSITLVRPFVRSASLPKVAEVAVAEGWGEKELVSGGGGGFFCSLARIFGKVFVFIFRLRSLIFLI